MLLQGSKWRAGGNHATSLGGDIRRIVLLVQLLQHRIVAVARRSRHCCSDVQTLLSAIQKLIKRPLVKFSKIVGVRC